MEQLALQTSFSAWKGGSSVYIPLSITRVSFSFPGTSGSSKGELVASSAYVFPPPVLNYASSIYFIRIRF